MIKAIIFDCFGVLTADAWHAFRVSLPPEPSQKAQQLNQDYDSGKITEEEFIKEVARISGYTKDYVTDVMKNDSPKNIVLLKYIASLKDKYKIGLLSNVANNWIRDDFLSYQEQKLFDQMLFSFELGITKPNPKIFHIAADRLGVNTAETVLIDDIDRYCEAAEREGMKAIPYKDFAQMKGDLEGLLLAST